MRKRSKLSKKRSKLSKKRSKLSKKHSKLSIDISQFEESIFGNLKKYKKIFNNFDLNYVVLHDIKRIGNKSYNGFVNEFKFERNNCICYAALKSVNNGAKEMVEESLYYECFVGTFINKLNKRFPCFIETYSIYNYTDPILYDDLMNQNNIASLNSLKPLFSSLNYNNFINIANMNISCNNNGENISILLQYLNNFESFVDIEKVIFTEDLHYQKKFFSVDLLIYFFQIFSCLTALKDCFTHYDLHGGNILLCNVNADNSNNKYIKMIYHYLNGEKIEFYTNKIAKIIDYGSCYFNDQTENISSLNFLNITASIHKCNDINSYKQLQDNGYKCRTDNICCSKKNISAELYLVKEFIDLLTTFDDFTYLLKENNMEELLMICENVKNNHNGERATTEILVSESDKIQNIVDFQNNIKNLINRVEFQSKNNEYYIDKECIGQIEVWLEEEKSMIYTSFL
jgi:hypothetical protein